VKIYQAKNSLLYQWQNTLDPIEQSAPPLERGTFCVFVRSENTDHCNILRAWFLNLNLLILFYKEYSTHRFNETILQYFREIER
jgi:hypothetical protein